MIKKTFYIALFIVTTAGVFSGLLFGSSQVIAFFRSGADQSQMLLLSGEQLNDYYQPKVTWAADHSAEGREMEPGTRTKITADYVAGHYYQFLSTNDGRAQGLKDYFTNKSREKLIRLAGNQESQSTSHKATTIEHQMTLKFYAEDGTLAVLNDVVITYNELGKSGETLIQYYDTSSYEVMLLLEDNFWRVRHKVRVNETGSFDFPQSKSEKSIRGGQFTYGQDSSFQLKCMNYYPKDFPWEAMWSNFDSLDLQSDFQEISEMGFNSLRIFIPYKEFGGAKVDARHLSDLQQLLTVAEQYDLKVIVTLFDFFLGYSMEQWTLADRHAEQIVMAMKDHPALFGWDIKNEPDLDFETSEEHQVISWLDFMIKRVKTYDPDHFVTIGWSQPEMHETLSDQVDFISFHYYRPTTDLINIQSVKPVMLGETGMHSFSAWWFPFSKTQEEQAQYIDEVLKIIADKHWSYGLWTLYDFPQVPSNVAGSAPWKKAPQKSMGLIQVDGTKKSAYDIIRKFNNTH